MFCPAILINLAIQGLKYSRSFVLINDRRLFFRLLGVVFSRQKAVRNLDRHLDRIKSDGLAILDTQGIDNAVF